MQLKLNEFTLPGEKYLTTFRKRPLREYESVFSLKISDLVYEQLINQKKFIWYDFCCGEFKAGKDLFEIFNKNPLLDLNGVDFTRIELPNGMNFHQKDVRDFKIPLNTNLVTCLWGLDYIERDFNDGIKTINLWYNQLKSNSILAFTYNLESEGGKRLSNQRIKKIFKRKANTKIISHKESRLIAVVSKI